MPTNTAVLALAASLTLAPALARAADFNAQMTGFEEVGDLNAETGAILTNGHAQLLLRLDPRSQTIQYQLTIADTTSAVVQAHIHFGRERQPGGPLAFLCSNANNGPAGTPKCPTGGGTVSGTIIPAQLLGIAAQDVPANNFSAIVAILASGSAYANVHTANFPKGEMRGQLVAVEQ